MNSVRSNNISLKYQRFTTLDSKDIVIIKSEYVARSQFLYKKNKENVGSFYKLFKKDCQFLKEISKETEPSQNSLILLFFKSRIVDRLHYHGESD